MTHALDMMKPYPQWVNWDRDPERGSKRPINPHTGYRASTNDPSTWGTLAVALRRSPQVGFMLTGNDPFAVIDYDLKGLDPAEPMTAAIREYILSVYRDAHTYAETSPSGKGAHSIFTLTDLDTVKKIANGRYLGKGKAGKSCIEVYASHGFITITGNTCSDKQLPIHCGNLYLTDFLKDVPMPVAGVGEAPNEPIRYDTATLIQRMKQWKNGAGDLITELMQNPNVVAERYGGDHNTADMALCNYIATATQNHEQALDVFRRSAIYRGDKGGKARYPTQYAFDYVYLLNTLNKRWQERTATAKANTERFGHIQFGSSTKTTGTLYRPSNSNTLYLRVSYTGSGYGLSYKPVGYR